MEKFVNFNSSPSTNNSFMSTIQSAGSKMNTTTILIIVAVILFMSIACAYYYFYIVPSSNAMYRANKELGSQNNQGDKEAELLFFYAEWCPHCKTAKPVWESLKTQYENKTINGYTVIFTEINCTTENAEVEKMMDKYNVEGFPTIKLLKDGQIIEYDAKPTKETLEQFLNTVLN
jgi:thiol-disulfide isomerase/thioredoxin